MGFYRINSVEQFRDSFYRSGEMPDGYVCSKCKAEGVKLWRQYQTIASHIELLCGPCALKDQKREGPINEDGKILDPTVDRLCDQIGWLVPSVPTEENDTFWGYTSVPASGVRWWRALPLLPKGKRDTK
jgi:hypothetical protein